MVDKAKEYQMAPRKFTQPPLRWSCPTSLLIKIKSILHLSCTFKLKIIPSLERPAIWTQPQARIYRKFLIIYNYFQNVKRLTSAQLITESKNIYTSKSPHLLHNSKRFHSNTNTYWDYTLCSCCRDHWICSTQWGKADYRGNMRLLNRGPQRKASGNWRTTSSYKMVVFFQASEWSDLIICPGQELEVWCMFWKIIWEISELIKVEKKTWQAF